jgi:hypothetical protein
LAYTPSKTGKQFMSKTTTSAPPLRHETTAGNYFVANYPPFAPRQERSGCSG